ncbi:MAG: hypothetical protein HY820_39805 [Acidobacteria bacterium]|nr:hypothetical protein [Acidobacteriota bacterium]
MQRRNFLTRGALAGVGLGMAGRLAALGTGTSTNPIRLDLSLSDLAGPPQINRTPEGAILFRVTVIINVTGDLTGKLTERVAQVHPENEEDSMPIATLWKLETAEGTLEGHYSGTFEKTDDGSTLVLQSGEVYWVTRTFGHLYRADVSYMASLSADQTSLTGRMTIRKR